MANMILKCIQPPCPKQEMVPLSRLDRSGRFTIRKVGGDRKLCARMGSLGIYPGAQAELICPHDGNQCILQLHGSRLCIDRSTSDSIIVSEF